MAQIFQMKKYMQTIQTLSLCEDEKQTKMLTASESIIPTQNVKISEDETEHILIERGDRNTDQWRQLKKFGDN